MVLNVGRRFWRRTEAEFDCPESVTFVKHTCREVLLMRMKFKPKWGYLLGNVDELCSPPLAPFERVDVEPVDIGPLHSQNSGHWTGQRRRLAAMGGTSLFFWLTSIGAGRMIGYW